METFRPLTGRSWAWGGGVLFPGLQGSEILEQLSEVMVGSTVIPSGSHWGTSKAGRFHRGWQWACVGSFRPD